MLAHPYIQRVERIYLFTTHHQRFYEQLGFVTNSSTAMVLTSSQSIATANNEIEA
nr:hypothetical protein [Chamaesiphon sp. OTE_75_metabat_556]